MIARIKENENFITVNHANINGFNCKYSSSDGKAECSKGDLPTYIKVVYLDSTDLTKECNESNSVSTTGTKSKCTKWYAYDETDSTYTMILNHNTTARYVTWNNRNTQLTSDTTGVIGNAKWVVTPRLITAQEIANITRNKNWNNNTFYFDSKDNWGTPTATSQGTSKYYCLYDYTYNGTSSGFNVAAGNKYNSKYIYGYWADNKSTNSEKGWFVATTGRLNLMSVAIYCL